ncbi:hypothetical protein ACR9E3_28605 [Actinomycetospora sp. C-140]
MAGSRLGRLFGRGRDDRAADTAPPEYTGIGAPRPYDAPRGAPGHGLAGYGQSVPPPRPASPRTRYDEAARHRRDADQQVGVLERFDAKLSHQIHEATQEERFDYVRELLSRQRAVRSRLEEATMRRNRLLAREEELGADRAGGTAGWGR